MGPDGTPKRRVSRQHGGHQAPWNRPKGQREHTSRNSRPGPSLTLRLLTPSSQDHEATSGDVISQIRKALQFSLPYKPNLVMINGGTNNAIRGEFVDEIYDQMDGILQDIWGYDDMGDTCVILSTLIPTEDSQGAINRITINSAYRRLVNDRSGDKCIYLADMEPTGEGSDFITLDGDYWADSPKVHPNVSGIDIRT